jgi:hypothetical protein
LVHTNAHVSKKIERFSFLFYITVSQLDGCTFNIVPVIRTVSAAGASYTVTVTASGGNCGWTASENSAWISLSRTAGAGTGPVGITVSANSGPARTATVSIAGRVHTVNQDPGLPVVTVTATDATAVERAGFPDPGTYRISRTGSTLATLNVYFTMSGTADNGRDYTAINSPISIGSRRSFVDVTLVPINDQNDEPDESAHMTILDNSAYTRGDSDTATVTIQDDDISALITCTDSSGFSGDLYYRGFYVPSYPGTSLSTVVLYLHAIEAGTYIMTLTARAGTYNGTVIGSRTIEVPLSSSFASPTYFSFSQRPRVTRNSRVTFALTLNEGPTDVVYDETQTPSGCPVVQTNNTTPPLSTFRRNGIAVLIYGDRF